MNSLKIKPNREIWKIFIILLITYFIFAMSSIYEANFLYSIETSLTNSPSPLGVINHWIYQITDKIGNHFNFHALIGRNIFLILSLIVNVITIYFMSVLFYYIKNKYTVQNFLKFKILKLILTVILFISTFFVDAYSKTCTGPFCEYTIGFPLGMMLITDYGPPISILAVIFNIWFWYFMSCTIYLIFLKYLKRSGPSPAP